MKTFSLRKEVISKIDDSQIVVQNANVENGGTTTQISTLCELLNPFSISLLSRVHDASGYFEIEKEKLCHFTF